MLEKLFESSWYHDRVRGYERQKHVVTVIAPTATLLHDIAGFSVGPLDKRIFSERLSYRIFTYCSAFPFSFAVSYRVSYRARGGWLIVTLGLRASGLRRQRKLGKLWRKPTGKDGYGTVVRVAGRLVQGDTVHDASRSSLVTRLPSSSHSPCNISALTSHSSTPTISLQLAQQPTLSPLLCIYIASVQALH